MLLRRLLIDPLGLHDDVLSVVDPDHVIRE